MKGTERCKQAEAPTGSGRDGGNDQAPAPVCSAQKRQEVRCGGAKGEGTHKCADEKTPVLLTPADGDFHADRIDTGEQGTCREPCKDRDRAAGFNNQKTRIEKRRRDSAKGKQSPRVDPVGKTQERRRECTDDKPDLDST